MRLLSTMSLMALGLSLGLGLAACSNPTANAQEPSFAQNIESVAATPMPINNIIVAELFTSQGCSSCPPAEAFFSELAEQEDILTIEWHVDYWDDLVHGGSRWKDPYSKKVFTDRQRSYNRSLRGQSSVYTPQAIINGHFEGAGSRPAAVNDMIENAPALNVPVEIQDNLVTIGASSKAADVLFVRLLKKHETTIKGGENKGRKLFGSNIALSAKVIGTTGSAPLTLTLPAVNTDESCAILIQPINGDVGQVLGAAKCA